MIFTEPRSWWDCTRPKLEDGEEEIWFQHPVYAIKCNQLGVLDFSEEDFTIIDIYNKTLYLRKKDPKSGKYIVSAGTKVNLVWECYHQKTTRSRILHKNHNELDFRFENLHSAESESSYQKTMRNKIKRIWETRSAEILVQKEIAMAKRGLDKETYRTLLMLPPWLTDAADSLV